MSPEIKFIYFDLGNVILKFDNDRLFEQVADVAGVDPEKIQSFFADNDFQNPLERGEISFDSICIALSESVGRSLDQRALALAVSDIFTINAEIIPIVMRLSAANMPIGILSNTSAVHWDFITDGRYGLLPRYFSVFALSFEVGTMKPHEKIYAAASELAGVDPQSIFFTDDRIENVESARNFGFQAEQFSSAAALARALDSAGVRYNY